MQVHAPCADLGKNLYDFGWWKHGANEIAEGVAATIA
jgi:hypothetical protein